VKTCSKCGETKPIDEFCKGKNICKICRSQYAKEYQLKNKDKINKRERESYLRNKDKRNKQQKEYNIKNRDKILEYQKEYYYKNREKILEKNIEYNRTRYKTDPKYRLNMNISGRVRNSLKGNKNGRHWEDLVGYTLNDLKKHIEKQFTDGMNWANYGEWHIDHIIPLSAFNFTKPKHIGFRKAWTLENLQPLWAEENLSKNAKLYYDFQGHLAI